MQVYTEFPEKTRAIFLDTIKDLMKHVEASFQLFKVDCEHRTGVGCGHDDFHKDFTLARICKLKDCPAMEEED